MLCSTLKIKNIIQLVVAKLWCHKQQQNCHHLKVWPVPFPIRTFLTWYRLPKTLAMIIKGVIELRTLVVLWWSIAMCFFFLRYVVMESLEKYIQLYENFKIYIKKSSWIHFYLLFNWMWKIIIIHMDSTHNNIK